MIKLLYFYITFIIYSPKFSPASLKEIVICKNNSMHISLNSNFDTPSSSSQSSRSNIFLQHENMKEDELASSTCKKKKIEAEVLEPDLWVKEEKREIYSNLGFQHICEIVKIQVSYEVQYREDYNYQSFQTLTLTLDDESDLSKVYTRKKSNDCILMVCQNI